MIGKGERKSVLSVIERGHRP